MNRLITSVLLFKLGVLLLNVRTFPRLKAASKDGRATQVWAARVSILVPARDEAENLRRTLPLLLAQGAAEVIVLDDGSQDDTAALAAALGAKVLTGKPLPAGWGGKNWACQQLAQAATGDLLLFTDADVDWQHGALGAVLAELERTRADLLSVWPRQHNVSVGERLLTPLLDDLLLCYFPAPLAALPFKEASAAIGQVMLFRRAAYERLGGHAAVRSDLMEDMALARALKASGGRLAVALGKEWLSVQMYRDYPQSVEGIAKMTLPFHRGWRAALPLTWALHVLVYSWPWLRLFGPRRTGPKQAAPLLLALLEGLLVRQLVGRTTATDRAEVLLTPLLPLLAAPVYWRAAQKKVRWKGREYEARSPSPFAPQSPLPGEREGATKWRKGEGFHPQLP